MRAAEMQPPDRQRLGARSFAKRNENSKRLLMLHWRGLEAGYADFCQSDRIQRIRLRKSGVRIIVSVMPKLLQLDKYFRKVPDRFRIVIRRLLGLKTGKSNG
jgi:hypothetical protein